MKNDFRDLAATLVNDKLKEYIDNRFAEYKKELNALKSDVAASTDISLETGSKVDNFMKLFQGACASAGAPKTLTVSASEPPKLTYPKYPKIAIPQTPSKIAPKEEDTKKGFDALEQMRIKQRVDAVAWLDAEFELSDLEGRILYFLLKCGPHTAHELKTYGVWRIANPVTYFLEEMEAKGLVKLFAVEKKWGITEDGIAVLNEDVESVAVQPVVTSDIVTQAKPAFKKIEKEPTKAAALGSVRAHVPEPQTPPSAIAPKPTLTVVPREPRVLNPVEPAPLVHAKFSYVEKAMVALLQKDMTITELQRAIGHTSNVKSLANMLYRCEREDGYIQYFYSQGKVYRITEKGRAYIVKVAPECRTSAAS